MYVKPPLTRSLGWLRKNIGIVLRDGPDAITVHVGEQVTPPPTTTTTLLLFLSSSAPCTPLTSAHQTAIAGTQWISVSSLVSCLEKLGIREVLLTAYVCQFSLLLAPVSS
jgi:hypothetical protein